MGNNKIKSKKILVISPAPTHPYNTGNRIRIYNLLQNLKTLGHDVYFVYEDRETKKSVNYKEMREYWGDKFYLVPFRPKLGFIKRIIRELRTLTLTRKYLRALQWKLFKNEKALLFPIDYIYNKNLEHFLSQLTKKIKFDVVFVEYVWLSKALDYFNDDILKIIDTHDLYTDRYKNFLKRDLSPLNLISLTAEEEAKGLNRADIIIAIQDKEKEFFSKLVKKEVVTIGHNVQLHKPLKRSSKTKNILFIGSDHQPNIKGIKHFIINIFPKVKAKFPDAKLIVAGGVSKVIGGLESCVKLGVIKDVQEAYNMADVVISPFSPGSGLKTKIVEALGYCKPVVTTPHGTRGLEGGKGKAFLAANTADKFADAIIKVFSDKKLYERLSKNAHKFIEEYNKKNLETLREILEAKNCKT